MELNKVYTDLCNQISDINEHLPTLKHYSSLCDSVTEFGVRYGTSLIAIISGQPKKITAYDIVQSINLENFNKFTTGIDFSFVVGDVLNMEIDSTDMLFIDTLHTYNQLSMELKKHSDKVKKYIIFHDTVSFGFIDEYVYSHASSIVKSITSEKQGLMTAINEFLEEGTFKIIDNFTNNNGLLVLERI